MKKNILKIGLLSLILLTISYIVILIFGRTYTVKFDNILNNDVNVQINDKSIIKIIDEKKDGNNYYVKVKGLKRGSTYIFIEYEDYTFSNTIYVHKNKVLTNNSFFGKSNASEVIPISLSIIYLYTSYILIKQYKKSKNDNLYQYKNIAYIGIIIFILFFAIYNILSIFNYNGLSQTIRSLKSSMSFISIALLPIVLITFTLVTSSNIILIRKEGRNLRNMLGLFMGIFIILCTLLPDFLYRVLMKSQVIDI